MWDKLPEHVGLDREQLHRLLEKHRPLLDACTRRLPNDIELSALAAMLHSFYNGVENILKRIAIETGNPAPRGEFWHKNLLDSMAGATNRRAAVLSPQLHATLQEYMEFRHVFRHAYVFDLRWAKMEHLVLGCERTLRQLERELDQFMRGDGRETAE